MPKPVFALTSDKRLDYNGEKSKRSGVEWN